MDACELARRTLRWCDCGRRGIEARELRCLLHTWRTDTKTKLPVRASTQPFQKIKIVPTQLLASARSIILAVRLLQHQQRVKRAHNSNTRASPKQGVPSNALLPHQASPTSVGCGCFPEPRGGGPLPFQPHDGCSAAPGKHAEDSNSKRMLAA